MTTTILLIRHGQTDWNVARRWQGHEDRPLNEVGIAQAQALARRLESWPVQAIYSSDLQRAAMTAAILGERLGITPIYSSAWRERDVGEFRGLTSEEVAARFPDVWSSRHEGYINPPGGEPQTMLYERVTSAFEELISRHQGEMVAVVSHGGALNAAISYVLGFSSVQYGRISLRGNTGLSIVEITDTGPRLVLLNDTCHLGQGL